MPQGDFSSLRKTGAGRVVDVISPLTIKMQDGSIIHLSGIDIPDLDYYNPGPLSITAMEILSDFLKNKNVRIFQTKNPNEGRQNRLGHKIAHIQRMEDDVWAQGLLLSLGAARVRTTKYTAEMGEQMLALEQKARAENHGIWAIDGFKVLNPNNAQEHIGSFQVVEGVVKSVAMRQNVIYLNFGHNWREDFTVTVPAKSSKIFRTAKINLQSWGGKKVRARGWVGSYNGPYIEADHPQQLELVENDNLQTPKSSAMANPNETNTDTRTHSTSPGSALPNLND